MRQDQGVLEETARTLADLFRTYDETNLAVAVEGAIPGDPARMPQRVLELFTHGMGGLLDCPLYSDGHVDRDATKRRDELAERLHSEARSLLS
jgi:hypothetical protein